MTDQPLRPPANIHLHPQDELGQIIQKIINDPAEELTLVVPEKSVLAQGHIALQVLADRVAQLHKKVTISSSSPYILTMAGRAGLPTEGAPTPPASSLQPPASTGAASPDSGLQPPDSKAAALKLWLTNHKVALSVASAFLIILLGGLMVANYYLPRATIIVYTDNRTIDRDVQLTASPDARQVNSTDMIIPATIVSAEDTIDQEFAATGEKQVGDRATGTITLTNTTETARSLNAGTVVASAGRSFVTTLAVTVPAATTEIEITDSGSVETTEFGTASVAIRASSFGPEYNLSANSTFKIANFSESSISGKNASALSGGTKETVKVVSAQDRQQALQELTDQSETEVTKLLKAKIQASQLLLEDAIEFKVTSSDFSHATDAQTSRFTLTLTVSASSPVVAAADIESLLTGTIEDKVPQGYKLTGTEPQIDNAVTEVEDDGTLHIVSTFRVQIVPDLNTDSLINQVKGKNPQVVEEFLRGQPNISGYDISLSPNLPGPLHRLPSRAEAIKVEIKVED